MSKRLLLALVVVLSLFVSRPASAVTLVFGSFSYVGPITVSYDQATGTLSASNVQVQFNYVNSGGSIVGTPATGYGPQMGTLSFTATRLSDVQTGFGLGAQQMKLDTFTIARDLPLGGKTNLLSGSASSTVFHGVLGGSVANLDGSMSAGSTIHYSSDFLKFPTATDADFSWALESVSPPLAVAGTNFRSYNASIAGTFGYNAPPVANVPEGSSLLMLAGGLLPIGMLIRKRRLSA